jgi:hypothetical protein
MRSVSGDRSGVIGVIIAIVVVVIIVLVAISLFLLPINTVQVNELKDNALSAGVQALVINLTVDTGSLEVRFVNTSAVAASMSIVGERRSGLLSSQDPVNITWSTSTIGDTLFIDSNVKLGTSLGWFSSSTIKCTLNISDQLRTSLSASTAVGGINITTANGVEISRIAAKASVGGIALTATNGTVLDGPVNLETSLGGLQVTWADVNATDNARMDLKASAGGIRMKMSQATPMAGNVNMTAAASLGGIELTMDLRGSTSARILSHADVGEVTAPDPVGFNGTEAEMSSQNYRVPSNFEVQCEADAGGINLQLKHVP